MSRWRASLARRACLLPAVRPTGRPCGERRTFLATYILISTLTDEGRKTLKDKPTRIQEVNREIEAMGAKVVGQWAVLGPYDFINVVELGARGTIQIMTLPAIPVEELQARLRK
jgi:uncharacterized protein with GYD domain